MQTNNNETMAFSREIGNYPIKVVALGGLNEMGKNCYVIEVDNDAFVIEAGLKYPNNAIPGVDVIIPDFEYIRSISHRVKGIILTHGHDDQYGALPYLLNVCKAPIYATETTVNIIESEYEKRFRKVNTYDFRIVNPSDTVTIAGHTFELFQTTHSVSESFGFALKTRFGNIVYTSDFISDYSPLKGFQFDLPKVARLSENEKTFLLMAESEAADKPGIASPNHKITDKIKDVFENQTGKIFISIYSQNFYNIQEVINLAKHFHKKICIANKNQLSFFQRMASIGNLVIPADMQVNLADTKITSNKDLIVLVTGSGESLFNLCKDICYNSISPLKVEPSDTWINAAPSVPGTEAIATEASDTIFRTDCHVLTLSRKEMASMHAQQEDLKMMISLFHPKYYMPVKGDYRLLMANALLAVDLGVGLNHFNTFVYDNGMALAFDENGRNVKKNILIRNGDVMVDGNSVGEVKEAAIDERTKMADGGVLIIGITYSSKLRKIVSSPDIQMRGFLYLSDSEPIVNQITQILTSNLNNYLNNLQNKLNQNDMQKKIADKVSKFVLHQTNKEPMVFCQLLDIDSLEKLS